MSRLFQPATFALCALSLAGCKARELGGNFADKQAASVDNTWLLAARSCWPDIMHSGYSLAGVKSYLSDPVHLRATFTAYSSFSDAALRDMVTKPVASAPEPDTSVLGQTSDRVLTRDQAVSGRIDDAVLPANNNHAAPPDALCAIENGVPAGFR